MERYCTIQFLIDDSQVQHYAFIGLIEKISIYLKLVFTEHLLIYTKNCGWCQGYKNFKVWGQGWGRAGSRKEKGADERIHYNKCYNSIIKS